MKVYCNRTTCRWSFINAGNYGECARQLIREDNITLNKDGECTDYEDRKCWTEEVPEEETTTIGEEIKKISREIDEKVSFIEELKRIQEERKVNNEP